MSEDVGVGLADTLEPPYYAVVFTSRLSSDPEGYGAAADRMLELARVQPGFLGVDTARSDGVGITVSYWATAEDIRAWRQHVEHREAQRLGRERWYAQYRLRVCRVERAYGFDGVADPG